MGQSTANRRRAVARKLARRALVVGIGWLLAASTAWRLSAEPIFNPASPGEVAASADSPPPALQRLPPIDYEPFRHVGLADSNLEAVPVEPYASGPADTLGLGASAFGPSAAEPELPLWARYKYNGGGGHLSLASRDGQYSANLQNQITLDGTFFDRQNMPTAEQGFNIPFLRTYLFGNVTESWQYQVATQAFLGQFNILDAFVNWRLDDRLNVRVGRGLSPFLYEYYAFSPAWEPVINNSLLFQLAGKRQEGVMAWGNLLEGTVQYQAGVFNGVSGAFYALDANVDFLGSITWCPLAGSDGPLECLGTGIGLQSGQHHYALNQTGSAFTNGAGEPTTNINYITSSGVPFFQYDLNTMADGLQTKFAPQLFWFDRFSILAEYLHCQRDLSLGALHGTTTQTGYYVNTSYWLTGERYTGNGLAGYTTITPLSPYAPRRGQCGPGAWEVAGQISQLSLSSDNFAFTSTPNQFASRCDQLMLAVNWWPNRYTRLSLDNVWTWFNRPIPLGGSGTTDQFNTVWMRCAMFF